LTSSCARGPSALDASALSLKGVARQPGQDSHDVPVHAGPRLAERDARDGGGRVGANPGELGKLVRGPGQIAGRRGRLRQEMQVAGPGVVAESLPELQDLRFTGGREGRKIGKGGHPAHEVGQHRRHLGLLEHELAHDGPVGGRRLAPRQAPAIRPVPGQQCPPERRSPRQERGLSGRFACHWR
jgi:hypothetical protein